jgi:alanine dehydrogenase
MMQSAVDAGVHGLEEARAMVLEGGSVNAARTAQKLNVSVFNSIR